MFKQSNANTLTIVAAGVAALVALYGLLVAQMITAVRP